MLSFIFVGKAGLVFTKSLSTFISLSSRGMKGFLGGIPRVTSEDGKAVDKNEIA